DHRSDRWNVGAVEVQLTSVLLGKALQPCKGQVGGEEGGDHRNSQGRGENTASMVNRFCEWHRRPVENSSPRDFRPPGRARPAGWKVASPKNMETPETCGVPRFFRLPRYPVAGHGPWTTTERPH